MSASSHDADLTLSHPAASDEDGEFEGHSDEAVEGSTDRSSERSEDLLFTVLIMAWSEKDGEHRQLCLPKFDVFGRAGRKGKLSS
jgi:hypothetical protein